MENIKSVFELSRTPMLAIDRERIVLANSRAEELFGKTLAGSPAVGTVPDHILANGAESFVATAIICEKPFCVSAARNGGMLYLSLAPEQPGPAAPEFVNESLMSTMLSNLFSIGLAVDRVGNETGGKGSEKLDSYLAILTHSYYQVLHSVTNLSSALALRKGSLPFSFRSVDLARLCSDVVSTVSVLWGKRGIDINFSTTHGQLFALADGEKVERILLNLISNSLAHTPHGGKINIGLEKSGDSAYISVDDTGCGIPTAEMAEIFTKYEMEARSPKLSALSSGGLGLGVARGLAEGHGGALLIESREGKGTSVRVMLPLRSSELSLLESGNSDYVNSGMNLILTELACVLDSGSYTREYMD